MEQENKITKSNTSILSKFIILTFLILLTALIFYFGTKICYKLDELDNNQENIPVFDENKTENTEKEETTTDIYCLKEYNGKIGIYQNDALVFTIDKFIFTLPENDKKLLKEGIYTTDIKEFYEILEQYY